MLIDNKERLGWFYERWTEWAADVSESHTTYPQLERLCSVGWKLERDQDEAWKHFHGWRVNYEAAAYGLALWLDAPPALWSGPRRKGRNQVISPARPSHRVPLEGEKEKLLQAGVKRRAARRAAEHEFHAHHDAEETKTPGS
jgi:hypothetical protein